MRALWILFILLIPWQGAWAHTRSQSASDWRIDGNHLQASFSVDSRRATLLYGQVGTEDTPLSDLVAQHLAETIDVHQNGVACPSTYAPTRLPATEGYERFEFGFDCPNSVRGEGAEITVGSFFAYSATHLHIIRVRSDGELVVERVLTGVSNRVTLFESEEKISALTHASGFIRVGISHVLSGWDHLAFLAALLLLARRFEPMLLTVTGFTLGHSLTMALVAFGVLRPHTITIEILIGFSIAYAAMEAARFQGKDRLIVWSAVGLIGAVLALGALGMSQSWPPVLALLGVSFFVLSQGVTGPNSDNYWTWRGPALAALFGLAHGAGFAGALLAYELDGAGLLWALLGFNVGVEVGQLAAIAIILLAVFGLGRLAGSDLRKLSTPTSAVLFGLGVFWTVSRILPMN